MGIFPAFYQVWSDLVAGRPATNHDLIAKHARRHAQVIHGSEVIDDREQQNAAAASQLAPTMPLIEDAAAVQLREQSGFRRTVLLWIELGVHRLLEDTLPYAIVVSATHAKLMRRLFFRACERCERQARRKQAHRMTGNCAASGSGDARIPGRDAPARTHPLLESYEGVAESSFLDKSQELMEGESRWEPLLAASHTRLVRLRLSKLLGRGWVSVSLRKQQRKDYPLKPAATVNHPNLISEIRRDAACPRRLDPWSQEFLARHPDLSSEAAQMELWGHIHMWSDQTLRIEMQHGWMRRFLHTRAAQGPAMDLSMANTWWIHKACRAHPARTEKLLSRAKAQKRSRRTGNARKKKEEGIRVECLLCPSHGQVHRPAS